MDLVTSNFAEVAAATFQAATKSIDLCFFVASPPGAKENAPAALIWAALRAAAARKIRLRLLLDKSHNKGLSAQLLLNSLPFLASLPWPVHFIQGGRCLHAKLFIVDNLHFYCGSHNLTGNACSHNFELGISGRDARLAAQLTSLYSSLWAQSVPLT